MSSQIKLCCFQCKRAISENSNHLCWFENHFCDSLCFQTYNAEQMAQSCLQCNSAISTVPATVPNFPMLKSSDGNFIFCDLKCVNQYEDEHVLCAYCSIEMDITDQSPTEANCQQFCSLECERRMNIHTNWQSMKVAMCSNCNQLKDVQMGVVVDGAQYIACSESCFMKIGRKNAIENGEFLQFSFLFKILIGFILDPKYKDVCSQCMQPFDGENNGPFVISDKVAAACNVFCSDVCMTFFMLNSPKGVNCSDCGTKRPYYHMVRSSMNQDQNWCSLPCLLRANCLDKSASMDQMAESGEFCPGNCSKS